jgi:hypothetical protein
MTEEPKIYKSIQEALLVYAKESKKNYNESMSAPVTIPDWKEPTAEELNGISLEQLIRDGLLVELKCPLMNLIGNECMVKHLPFMRKLK